MFKILTVLGNRPQFIKATLLSGKFSQSPDFQEVIVHTGQHFDHAMSGQFFDELHLPEPSYNLEIDSLPRIEMVAEMTTKLFKIIIDENPDLVIVYGDTNSTLAGALAANVRQIPVAHIEAGVRSFDRTMPEEKNRWWVDKISKMLFAPSKFAVKFLTEEDYNGDVVFAGDIMKNLLLEYKNKAKKPKGFDLEHFILATIHRQSNTDDGETLAQIMDAFNILNKDIPVVLPLHPRTRKALVREGIHVDFKTINPVSYLEMLYLLQAAEFVITDSGGLQKEAYYCQKPTIVVRGTSEWNELVGAGYSFLCQPVSTSTVLENVDKIKNRKFDFTNKFYGEGNTVDIIFSKISDFLSLSIDTLD